MPEIINPNGAYVKFSITLEKQSLCSQIAFSLFTKYPMEIVSLKYEEDIETYHEAKELVQHLVQRSSSGQLKATFPNVLAKRFTIVMNQPNYEKNTYIVRKNWGQEKSLWNQVMNREVDITLNTVDGLETVEQAYLNEVSGWDYYLTSLNKYNADMQAWQARKAQYDREYSQYQQEYNEYKNKWGIYSLSNVPVNVLSNSMDVLNKPVFNAKAVNDYKNPAKGLSSSDYRIGNNPLSDGWSSVRADGTIDWAGLAVWGGYQPLSYWEQSQREKGYSTGQGSAWSYIPDEFVENKQLPNQNYNDDVDWCYVPPKPKPPPPPPPIPPTSPGAAPTFTFETQREEVKYEYVQGIRNIRISGEEYAQKSIYVSKPIEVPGNIVEVSMVSEEEHPLFDEITGESNPRQTSVEYYISYETNPSLEDWHAILPEEQKEVLSELLIFERSSLANLRFIAIATKEGTQQGRVYKDSVLMGKDKWSFANGGRQIQLLEAYNPAAIYTVDYTPNADIKNPWVLNVVQDNLKKIRQVDRFPEGTNRNKTVILSKYPYVNYESINQTELYDPNTSKYQPLSVRILNANIVGPNRAVYNEVKPYVSESSPDVFTKNVTDYKADKWKMLRPYSIKSEDPYKGFEYFHEQNKLYFSETFNKADIQTNIETNHGNGTIEVSYEYLVSSFRMKIILRRSGPGVNSITPEVYSYALKLKSMS